MSEDEDGGSEKLGIGDGLAEARLLEAAIFLDSIIENIPDMIFVKEAEELRFVRFNRAGEELLGFPRSDMIGKNDFDFFPKEEADFFTQKDREVLAQGGVVDIPEEPIHTKLLGKRWLHTKKIPIRGADGTPRYLLGISEDITDIREARRELAQRTEQLAAANRELAMSNAELQEFVYVASHDLQEPLRGVAGYLDLLQRRCASSLDDMGNEYIRRAMRSAQRMSELIEDLLRYSRLTRAPVQPSVFDLSERTKLALEDLKVAVEEAAAKVVVAPGLPAVYADQRQVGQVLQNLIANALKFRRTDGEIPTVYIDAESRGQEVRVTVRDNGIGIDPEYFDRIFRAFQRLHSHSAYPGSGIGLAVCQKIVERHGGKIGVESALGEGSTFWFTLPAAA